VNRDIVLSGLLRIPKAETESLAQGMRSVIGGQTATVARTLARLGTPVSFVGRVGDDAEGRAALQELADCGVEVGGVVVDPVLRTGATVVLSTGAERAYATFPGALAELRRSDVAAELLSACAHLHVGSYYLLEALRPDMTGLFEEARRRGLTTSLDPGWDPSGEWGTGIQDLLPLVDVFLPNAVEAKAITRKETPLDALQALGDCGTVVIKMGRDGCVARDRSGSLRCRAFSVRVQDVTGAGDVFDAGFLHGYLAGWGLADCLRFASACGAISVSRPGGGAIMTGPDEVLGFLSDHEGEARPRAIQGGGQE
jgi:sugar/nucleoside kinase (ribokinase family)